MTTSKYTYRAFADLTLLSIVIVFLSGCGSHPVIALNVDPSKELPAVLELTVFSSCGILTHIEDNQGRKLFDYLDSKYRKNYPSRIQLKPDRYIMKYEGGCHSTDYIYEEAAIEMESGHTYALIGYCVIHEALWLWIEDRTTSMVAGGRPPPPGVKRKWQGLGSCPSTALEYLQ